MFEKVCLSTHVTVLKVVGDLLFEGSGGSLNVYGIESKKCLQSLPCFKGAVVHGIRCLETDNPFLAVYGAKQFAVIQITHKHDETLIKPSAHLARCVKTLEENDWIWDLKFLDNKGQLGLLLAHNTFSLWNWKTAEKLSSVLCEEKCILYCGSIIGHTWENLAILSGTVFQEILIWKPRKDLATSPILHRLQGHKGVIFSVQYSPQLKAIVSTSDDRSVRTWSVQFQKQPSWESCTLGPQLCLFGHSARVMQALNLCSATPKPNLPGICSLGEDSCVVLWSLEGKIVAKWRAHGGAPVWTADYHPTLGILITGGGDGAIKCWNLANNLSIAPNMLPFPNADLNYPRLLALSNTGSVYMLSSKGDLLHWQQEWSVLDSSNEYVNASTFIFNLNRAILAIGTLKGQVALYDTSANGAKKLAYQQAAEGKVFSLIWLSDSLLLVCGKNGKMNIWEWNENKLAKQPGLFVLPPCQQRWAASALLHEEQLLVGDRDGSLHIYSMHKQSLVRSLQHFHGQEGITSLTAWPGYIISTGKDGSVKVCDFGIDCSDEECVLREDVTHLGWTSNALAWQEETLVTGFSSSDFVLWSCAQQRDLLRIPCGGGHRSWDFLVAKDSEAVFVFIKDKKVFLHRTQLQSIATTSFKSGLHTKSVQSCITLDTLNRTVFITGGEDTEIRLHYLNGSSLSFLTTIRSHISSVRTLSVCEISKTEDMEEFLMLSGGGRAQLVATKLKFEASSDGAAFSVNCHHLTSYLLRGNSKPSKKRPWLNPVLVPDPETRYMDVNLWHYEDSVYRIAAACSDGTLRLFSFDFSKRNFTLQEAVAQDPCLLRVRMLSTAHLTPTMITTGNDGHLSFWGINPLVLQARFGCHQSGVNALDITWLTDSKFLLITGGDDNAIHCSLVEQSGNEFRVLSKYSNPQAHGAQITGARFLTNNYILTTSIDQRLVLWQIVLSVDPIVESASLSLIWRKAWLSSVADIQGLHVFRHRVTEGAAVFRDDWHACVFGQGLEVLACISLHTGS